MLNQLWNYVNNKGQGGLIFSSNNKNNYLHNHRAESTGISLFLLKVHATFICTLNHIYYGDIGRKYFPINSHYSPSS